MTKAPRYMKVGANTYSLRITKKAWKRLMATDVTAHESCGYTSINDHEIVIDPEMSETNVKSTVVHEVIHALLEDTGVTWPLSEGIDQEETLCRILGPRLFAWLVDNPDLVAWIASRPPSQTTAEAVAERFARQD